MTSLEALSCAPGKIPPAPTQWITDPQAFLSSPRLVAGGDGRVRIELGAARRLDAKLRAYEAATLHQVIVWISDRPLGTDPVPQFCHQAFNAWGIGRHGYNDGVVIFVFPSPPGDRFRIRIQVGRGLEEVLTDRESARIAHLYGPAMERGEHDAGLEGMVDEIIAVIGVK